MTNEKREPAVWLRWTALIAASLAMFGNYYLYDSIAPIALLLKEQLSYTDLNIGQLYTAYAFSSIIILIFGGVFIDRFGTRISIVIFGSICALAGAVTAASPNLYIMITGRVLLGIGAENLIVAITVAIAKWFKNKEIGLAMGVNLSIARLGQISADWSPTWGESFYHSWQPPLIAAAIIGLFCILGGLLYYFLEAYGSKRYNLSNQDETDKLDLKKLFSFPASFWYVTLLCVTFYSAVFPFRTFAIKFYEESYQLSTATAGQYNSLLPTASLILTPFVGLLVDVIGRRSTLMFLGAGLLLPVFLIMGYAWFPLQVPIIMFGVAFSLIPAIMWPSVAYIVDINKLGTAYAVMFILQQAGVAFYNLIIGWANDASGASAANPQGYLPGMWLFSILGILAFVFAFMLWKTERGPRSHGLEYGMKWNKRK